MTSAFMSPQRDLAEIQNIQVSPVLPVKYVIPHTHTQAPEKGQKYNNNSKHSVIFQNCLPLLSVEANFTVRFEILNVS